MSHGSLAQAPRPAHVPPELVVDFNVYGPERAAEDLHGAWRKLQHGPDIVWAPYHGGHWLFTRHEDIDFAQRNHDPFSMRDVTMPANTRPTRLLPLEADPPEHTPFRAILNPWFSPKRISDLKEFTRELAVDADRGIQAAWRMRVHAGLRADPADRDLHAAYEPADGRPAEHLLKLRPDVDARHRR